MDLELDNSSDHLTMDENALYNEVEDIMCDQGIISKELNAVDLESKTSNIILSTARLRFAVAVCARAVVPRLLRIYYVYLRNQQLVVDSVRHHLVPAVVAFLANGLSGSLASVQRRIAPPPEPAPAEGAAPERSVECRVLFAPRGWPAADVVFVHGLHGGVDRTWRQGRWRGGRRMHRSMSAGSVSHNGLPAQMGLKRTLSDVLPVSKVARRGLETCVTREEGEWEVVDDVEDLEEDCYSNCWPQDWLPKDCPGVRVIALNYTTDVLWCPVWKKKRRRTDMIERSEEMIEELIQLGVGKKPIIWVGHSKGGLFIKQIIMNAWEKHKNRSDIFQIFQNSKGITFYSVPHKGSALADFTLPLLRRSVELIEIQRNCDFVLDLHRRFLEICKEGHLHADIFSFIETSFTLMSFIYLKIVAYESADPDIGVKYDVPLDHREICKPAGRDCFLYIELVKLIKKHSLNDR